MKALIFANSDLAIPSNFQERVDQADLIIAADGGSRHILDLDLQVDVVIGDLDSLSSSEVTDLESKGARFIRFPREKDQSDLELALLEAQKNGVEEVHIVAALGRRWDHSLINLMLPANEAFRGLKIEFLHGVERIFLIQGEAKISGTKGTRLSLVPISGMAKGLSTQGLRYPLHEEDLHFGSSRGLSNLFDGEEAYISLEDGSSSLLSS